MASSPASMRRRFSPKARWMASVSARTGSSARSGMAARCSGFEPPPSRNEPALATASMTGRGATVQVVRQPG